MDFMRIALAESLRKRGQLANMHNMPSAKGPDFVDVKMFLGIFL